MFKWKKSLDVVTLFHKKSSPASIKMLDLLKETNVRAATDSVEGSSQPSEDKIAEFELDVVEEPPTPDQLSNILEYVGQPNVGKVIQGASNATNAMKIFRSDAQSFQRPLTVTWETGKAVVGDNPSEILRLLAALPKNN